MILNCKRKQKVKKITKEIMMTRRRKREREREREREVETLLQLNCEEAED